MAQAIFQRRLEIAELGTAVVAPAREANRQHPLMDEERSNGVGELDLAAGARHHFGEQVENPRREDVAPDYAEV